VSDLERLRADLLRDGIPLAPDGTRGQSIVTEEGVLVPGFDADDMSSPDMLWSIDGSTERYVLRWSWGGEKIWRTSESSSYEMLVDAVYTEL
jgi:hypothetical protein